MSFFNWGNTKGECPDKIDFSKMSNSELLDQFLSINWNAINEENRVGCIQEIENRSAVEQGREAATIVSMHNSNNYGQYNNMGNVIDIDVTTCSSYETFDTYWHESYGHAMQYQALQTGKGYEKNTLDMMQVELARDENGKLYNYSMNSVMNGLQTVELDANNKAAEKMMAESNRYKEDLDYKQYIEDRNTYFNGNKEYYGVLEDLEAFSKDRTALQNQQVYASYVRGDISEEQYQTLNQHINNPDYIEQTVENTNFMGNALQDLQVQLFGEVENEAEVQTNVMDWEFNNDVGEIESENVADWDFDSENCSDNSVDIGMENGVDNDNGAEVDDDGGIS